MVLYGMVPYTIILEIRRTIITSIFFPTRIFHQIDFEGSSSSNCHFRFSPPPVQHRRIHVTVGRGMGTKRKVLWPFHLVGCEGGEVQKPCFAPWGGCPEISPPTPPASLRLIRPCAGTPNSPRDEGFRSVLDLIVLLPTP